jgi:hypothetical protein
VSPAAWCLTVWWYSDSLYKILYTFYVVTWLRCHMHIVEVILYYILYAFVDIWYTFNRIFVRILRRMAFYLLDLRVFSNRRSSIYCRVFVCSKYSSLRLVLWCQTYVFSIPKIFPSPHVNSTNLSMRSFTYLIIRSRIENVLVWWIGTAFYDFARFSLLHKVFGVIAWLAFLDALSAVRVAGFKLVVMTMELLAGLPKLNYTSIVQKWKATNRNYLFQILIELPAVKPTICFRVVLLKSTRVLLSFGPFLTISSFCFCLMLFSRLILNRGELIMIVWFMVGESIIGRMSLRWLLIRGLHFVINANKYSRNELYHSWRLLYYKNDKT